MRKEQENIDFLKIVFIVAIICYHCVRKIGFWNEGSYAVELFFVISGYLLAKQSIADKDYTTNWDFAKEKIKKWFPLVLTISLTNYLCGNHSLNTLLNNLTFSPNISDLACNIAWYVNVLLWLSLFYFYIIKHLEQKYVNLIISLLIFISWYVLQQINFVRGSLLGPKGSLGHFFHSAILTGFFCMGIGYFLSFLKEDKSKHKSYFYTILEILFLGYPLLSMFNKSLYISAAGTVYAEIILLVLFIKSKGYLSTLLNKVSWHYISKYVLSIYLLQDIVVKHLFGYILKHQKPLVLQHGYISSFLLVLASFIIGIIGYYIIQKPSEKLINKLGNKTNLD